MKDITIKTGPHGGLGNIAIQTTPYQTIKSADIADIKLSDSAIRKFMAADVLGHDQRVFRISSRPVSQQSLTPVLNAPNTHITTVTSAMDGTSTDVVKNGASSNDLRKLIKGQSGMRQVDIDLEASIHGTGNTHRIVKQRITLLHEGYSDKVVGVIDHMKGAADGTVWDRFGAALQAAGGKILKHVTRA